MILEKYDVTILGAGPSGSTAAHWAAKLNLKAVIVDQKSFPRDKVCGDGLPIMTFELLKEMELNLYDLPSDQSKKVNSIEINTPTETIQLDSTTKSIFNVSRKDFDYFLWSRIPKCVTKYEEYRPIQVRYDIFKRLYRVEISNSGHVATFYTSYIIGADGANSWVRKKIGLFADFIMEFTSARRAYATALNGKDSIELNYVSPNSLSYVWQFSLPNNKLNIGTYFSPMHAISERKNGKEHIEELEAKSGAKVDWNSCKSFPIPTFHPSVSVFSRSGVFLVGDAAGFSDPIFGHGIDIGMLSGKTAVLAISKAKNMIVFDRKKKASQLYNYYVNENIVVKFQNMRKYMDENEDYRMNDIMKLMRDNLIVNNEFNL